MSLRLLVLSDLHFEFHRDGGGAFVGDLPPGDEVDVCVLAGDITTHLDIPAALELFCRRYPRVVYVTGNHEHYHSSRGRVFRHVTDAVEANDNLLWLEPGATGGGVAEIDGQRFIGATLWFRRNDTAPKQMMNDFHVIESFEEWVYQDNAKAIELLDRELRAGDVVVTHHLPSQSSVHPRYAGSALNAFFVCDLEGLLRERRPRLWIHGHTHCSLDYRIGETRVVCNPFGYARYEENRDFDWRKVIDLKP